MNVGVIKFPVPSDNCRLDNTLPHLLSCTFSINTVGCRASMLYVQISSNDDDKFG